MFSNEICKEFVEESIAGAEVCAEIRKTLVERFAAGVELCTRILDVFAEIFAAVFEPFDSIPETVDAAFVTSVGVSEGASDVNDETLELEAVGVVERT